MAAPAKIPATNAHGLGKSSAPAIENRRADNLRSKLKLVSLNPGLNSFCRTKGCKLSTPRISSQIFATGSNHIVPGSPYARATNGTNISAST